MDTIQSVLVLIVIACAAFVLGNIFLADDVPNCPSCQKVGVSETRP